MTPEQLLYHISLGDPLVILDDLREYEGDLFCAAQVVTIEALEFMVRKGSGLLCLALPRERLEDIGIPRFSDLLRAAPAATVAGLDMFRTSWFFQGAPDTPFHLPVDRRGLASGISLSDRYATIKALIAPTAHISQFEVPGHLITLGAHPRGLLGRRGHTEAAVELAQAAGVGPGGLLCEILGDAGEMLKGEDLEAFASQNGLPMIRISQLSSIIPRLAINRPTGIDTSMSVAI